MTTATVGMQILVSAGSHVRSWQPFLHDAVLRQHHWGLSLDVVTIRKPPKVTATSRPRPFSSVVL